MADSGDHKRTKINLAMEQLEDALTLFTRGRYISALTLSGAAEELLGKALSQEQKTNSLDWKYEVLEPLLDAVTRTKKELISAENLANNSAKHFNSQYPEAKDSSEDEKEAWMDAAIWMIVRACDNADRLGLPRSKAMHEFDAWFHEHVVGDIAF